MSLKGIAAVVRYAAANKTRMRCHFRFRSLVWVVCKWDELRN